MSEVTNVILSLDEGDFIKQVNTWFESQGTRGLVLVNDTRLPDRWYGGNKYLEVHLAIGAFNHLDLDGLVRHLRAIDWMYPEAVQLIIKEQEEVGFRIINLFDETEPPDAETTRK